MRNPSQGQVLGIAVNSSSEAVALYTKSNFALSCQSKRVKSGLKITEAVKRKLSLGTRILQAGGIKRLFRQLFTMVNGEKLLKAFQCSLSTSAGTIAGLLFISTERVAFHSDRRIRLTSANEEVIRIPYKVVIPLDKIKRASPSEVISKPEQKYIQIITVDGFEFWYMGFLNYQRTLRYLHTAVLHVPTIQL